MGDFIEDGKLTRQSVLWIVVAALFVFFVTVWLVKKYCIAVEEAPTTSSVPSAALTETLVRVIYKTENTFNQYECSICFGDFLEGEELCSLPSCQHLYHASCIAQWIQLKPSCPLCVQSITISEEA